MSPLRASSRSIPTGHSRAALLAIPARAPDWWWVITRGLTGLFLVLSVTSVGILVSQPANLTATTGIDRDFYVRLAERFLAGQGFYAPEQLAGPYAMTIGVSTLYPPTALFLFVPFVYLPAVLWWAIPLGVVGYVMWWLRPAPWTWPLLAFALWWPRDMQMVILGNTGMWVAAAIAGGIRWGWPGPLVLLKPTFMPFAIVGFGRRAWWVGLGLSIGLGLLTIPLWADYRTAMNNGSGLSALWYTLPDLPLMLAPAFAWLGSPRRS